MTDISPAVASATTVEPTLFGSVRRATVVMWAVVGGYVAGIGLSIGLWLPHRWYPLNPVTGWLPEIPTPLGYVWVGALLAAAVAILLVRNRQWWIVGFLVLIGLLGLWDQSRWQPWAYQYFFLLAALSLYPWQACNPNAAAAALNTCRLIIAVTYVWSGAQKVNFSFVDSVYPWLVEPVLDIAPRELDPLVHLGAVLVPFMEMGIGIGLLIRPFRTIAIGLAIAMHLFLLVVLSPLGHDWNSVIWPWNVVMPVLVVALFWQAPEARFRDLWWPRVWLHGVVIVLFAVMPLFSFLGLWDQYLSAALYSGNTARAGLYLSAAGYHDLPAKVRREARPLAEDRYYLSLDSASLAELNVPPYPAERIYRGVARELRTRTPQPSDVVLVIETRPHWLTGARTTIVDPGTD